MTHRSLFQKPQESRAAKYLNLNVRKSKFQVFEKQLFSEQGTQNRADKRSAPRFLVTAYGCRASASTEPEAGF
jgi:hypothetical protein